MQSPIIQFRNNLESVKKLNGIYTLLIDSFPLLKEDSFEILRAEIVLTVSALDCFIHDLVRVGMIETYEGDREASKSFSKFTISLQSLQKIIETNSPVEKRVFLEAEIRKMNSSDSFQSPKSIEYALQLINITKVWAKIAPDMNMSAKDVRDELSLIINRRNKIAHEADFDAVNRCKYPISQAITNDIIAFIESLCESINKIILIS